LVGHNTDWLGVREPLRDWIESERVLTVSVIGTGGAAAAAILAVLRRPGSTQLLNYGRTLESARAFRLRLDEEEHASAPISNLRRASARGDEPELLINASPLGMRGHPPLEIDLDFLAPGSTVFDMVYDPLETELLREAQRRGLRVVDGLTMLVAQAAAAFELFFCAPAPREHDDELRGLLTA
jgi:shikimate dehydrogenase